MVITNKTSRLITLRVLGKSKETLTMRLVPGVNQVNDNASPWVVKDTYASELVEQGVISIDAPKPQRKQTKTETEAL